MQTAHGSTIYCCDSMNGNDIEREKSLIPANLVTVVKLLGDTCTHPRDCGLCVNEIARAFAHDPDSFVGSDSDVNFEPLSDCWGESLPFTEN